MLPVPTGNNRLNRNPLDSVETSELCRRDLARDVITENGAHLLLRENMAGVAFTAHQFGTKVHGMGVPPKVGIVASATLGDRIVHIVCGGSGEDMRRIAARGIIASMERVHSIGPIAAVVNHPGNPMRGMVFPEASDDAIPKAGPYRHPWPAFIWTTDHYLGTEQGKLAAGKIKVHTNSYSCATQPSVHSTAAAFIVAEGQGRQ